MQSVAVVFWRGQGTPEKLILQLIENNAIDQSYIDDFLLMHRTFLKSPLEVMHKLLSWLQDPASRERVCTSLPSSELTNVPSNFLKSMCTQNFLCATFY